MQLCDTFLDVTGIHTCAGGLAARAGCDSCIIAGRGGGGCEAGCLVWTSIAKRNVLIRTWSVYC